MMNHQSFCIGQIKAWLWAVCVCLIVSLSVNNASAKNTKCAAEKAALDKISWHETPIETSKAPFFNLAGDETSLADYKGKVVILTHWAIWCAPCLREMPSLMRLSDYMNEEKAALIALSMDRSGREKVQHFILRKNWKENTIFHDDKMAFARASKAFNLPTTQIINQDGLEIGRLVGTLEWDDDKIKSLVDCLTQ